MRTSPYRLPPEIVGLRVDCAGPERSGDDYGYADFHHDGAVMFIKFSGVEGEIELRPEGARIFADALLAFADTIES